MRVLFAVVAVAFFAISMLAFTTAKSSFHEITSALLMLTAVVAAGFSSLLHQRGER